MNGQSPARPLALVVEDEPNLSEIYCRAVESAQFLPRAFRFARASSEPGRRRNA